MSGWLIITSINPPEAIWNLVTKVATPQSVGPGFFNPVATPWSVRPGFFFLTHFAPGRQRPYHGVTDLFFLTPVAIPRSVRPGLKKKIF